MPPLAESDGEALFIARARAVDPSFVPSEAVGELCAPSRRAPARARARRCPDRALQPRAAPRAALERLDLFKGERDADPRQQTLRATIEWSYDLLSEGEQRLFRRLSVFAGGCSYEAAEEVAGADPDTLQSLLDKSLLRKRQAHFGPRYWMLETIREYAAELLAETGDLASLRDRHLAFYLAAGRGGGAGANRARPASVVSSGSRSSRRTCAKRSRSRAITATVSAR